MKDYTELRTLCEDVVNWPVKTADERAWHGVAVQTLELLNERDSLINRIANLEKENFTLAAGQCLFSDGSGLYGDEHGNPRCRKAERQ